MKRTTKHHYDEDWPEPRASLLELEPVSYTFHEPNLKPIFYFDPVTSEEYIIFSEFYNRKNKGIYKYNVKQNTVIKYKDIPNNCLEDDTGYKQYGHALDESTNTLYVFDAKLQIMKLSLNNENNVEWIEEYNHIHLRKCHCECNTNFFGIICNQ